MSGNLNLFRLGRLSAFTVILLAQFTCSAFAAPPVTCTKIVLTGQVTTGQEWRQSFGQGWIFRLLPVDPGKAAYSGWDLAVDRDPPTGYPDALLLATPPYNSINEREIATTFGLRAQDAIGWNPRSFRFFTDPATFRQARRLFLSIGTPSEQAAASPQAPSLQQLMTINQHTSAGQLRILDARITPGTADAAPFAQKWALQSPHTPHTIDAASTPTPRGALHSIRFSITLWLPADWRAPRELNITSASCER